MIEQGFRFVDLFCGIGGFHQAMASLGGRCVFACDNDEACREVYLDNYGIMPAGDITKVDAADIEPFDVLCAGFPCQSFSHAGKQLGFNDPTRGTLFFDVMRIARHHMPRYMLLENVKNLALHDGGRTWKVIYDSIRECGYNVLREPVIFSPHYIGIPQNRERVLIMCVREDVGDIPQFHYDSNKKLLPLCSVEDILLPDDRIPNIEKYRISQKQVELIDLWDDLIRGLKCDLPGCPIYGEYLKEDIVEKTEGFDSLPKWKQDYIRKNQQYYIRHREFLDGWKERAKGVEMYQNTRRHLEWQTYRREDESMWNHIMQFRQSGLRVKRTTYFPALVAIVQTSILAMRGRYVVPRECARMQSFPDSFRMHPDDHVAYKQFGNSVNVEVARLFARFMFGDPEIRAIYTDPDADAKRRAIEDRLDDALGRMSMKEYPTDDEKMELGIGSGYWYVSAAYCDGLVNHIGDRRLMMLRDSDVGKESVGGDVLATLIGVRDAGDGWRNTRLMDFGIADAIVTGETELSWVMIKYARDVSDCAVCRFPKDAFADMDGFAACMRVWMERRGYEVCPLRNPDGWILY